jgi:F0F1-type ATP synthase gamma subunit
MERFTSGEVDKVTVVFSDFINTLTQVPRARTVLPITSLEVNDVLGDSETKLAKTTETRSTSSNRAVRKSSAQCFRIT